MALGEGGLPYALRVMCDGVFETIGQASFDGQMKTVFTAHPKKDPSTGKLYGFANQVGGMERSSRVGLARRLAIDHACIIHFEAKHC